MVRSKKMIIDSDPGNGVPGANVDDALAISYALKCPTLHLSAIWTVFGNTTSYQGYRSAQALMRSLCEEHTILRRGSEYPMNGERDKWIHKREQAAHSAYAPNAWKQGLALEQTGRQPLSQASGDENPSGYGQVPGVCPPGRLAQDLLAQDEPIDLVVIGPLTNIANILLAQPAVVAKIRRITIMGGALGFDDLVDTNCAVDPQAADIVLHAAVPITVVPLDVTRTTHLSNAMWQEIYRQCDPDLAPWKDDINGWLLPWLQFSQRTRPVDGMWVHDLVAVATISRPDIVTIQRQSLRLATNGKLHRAADGPLPGEVGGIFTVDVCTNVDNASLIQSMAQAIMPGKGVRDPAVHNSEPEMSAMANR